MQNVFVHLAYLLTEHNCVIIPGFGGFVVHREKSHYLDEECIFTAPAHTVGFNDRLIHNDGLLINSLMSADQIDYPTAVATLERLTEEIKQNLSNYGEVTFPHIGKLSVTSEGNYRFDMAAETPVNASSYGLTDVYLPLLSELEAASETKETERKRSDDTIMIPISKRFVKTVASAAAIVVFVLMISTPIDNTSAPKQYASVIESGISIPPVQLKEPEAPVQTDGVESREEAVAATEEEKEIPATTEPEQTLLPTPDTAPQPAAQPAEEATHTRSYYIIVAGTPSKSKAESLLSSIRTALLPQAEIIERNNMSRIYIARFSDKKAAEDYLEDFREQNPKYKDAWLLSVR